MTLLPTVITNRKYVFCEVPSLTLDHMITDRMYVFCTISRPFIIVERASFGYH
jgi:hypothetical protein